jgi:hypothetical protein
MMNAGNQADRDGVMQQRIPPQKYAPFYIPMKFLQEKEISKLNRQ